jgi:hypothetical protein
MPFLIESLELVRKLGSEAAIIACLAHQGDTFFEVGNAPLKLTQVMSKLAGST